jgi:hypothetical protein
MNQTDAHPSFTEDCEIQLYSSYKKLRSFGCTYMYYTINHPIQGRLRFSTNEEWINLYLEENLIKNDPIKAVCEQKKSRILSWNQVPILSPEQKKTMEARGSFGIYNGINIIQHDSNGISKIIALCTDSKSHDFGYEILKNSSLLKEIVSEIFAVV